jgi:hypothetical protein
MIRKKEARKSFFLPPSLPLLSYTPGSKRPRTLDRVWCESSMNAGLTVV